MGDPPLDQSLDVGDLKTHMHNRNMTTFGIFQNGILMALGRTGISLSLLR